MNASYLRSIYLRLAGAVMLIIALTLAVNAFFAQREFEQALAPDMGKKVAVAAASTRALIVEALEHNVVVAEIYGIDQTFDELKQTIPDIAYAALTDTQGKILFERFTAPGGAASHFRTPQVLDLVKQADASALSVRVGEQYIVSLPVVAPQGAVGILHIGISVAFVNRITTDMLWDVVVVLVVALFFTLELLHFLAGRRIESALNALGSVLSRGAKGDFAASKIHASTSLFGGVITKLDAVRTRVNTAFGELANDLELIRSGPTHERPAGMDSARSGMLALAAKYRFGTTIESAEISDDDKLARVRAPLFAFILAEELTRPFLPGYVKDLLVNVSWISPEIMVGLPIVLFMLIVALGQPFMGVYASKVGSRRAMTVGAAVATAGFLLSAMASSVLDLLLWRALCALGYGIVFVAAQAHVLEYSNINNRARSFAVFISAIMVATVCGPSIGGILADNIGERQTLVVAALVAAASIFAIRMMPAKQARIGADSRARMPMLKEIGSLMFNARFMTVTGLAAMPAKMLLTGLCFYLVPLYLLSIGSTQAVAGRVLMTYGVMMVMLMPMGALLATTRQRMELLVASGLVVSGLGGLMLWLGHGEAWVYAAVVLVGGGQSLSIAAQSALIREHCDVEVAQMGEPAVYGVYRLLERLGNALGPLLAGALVLTVGYRQSFVIAGATVLCCGVLFFALTRTKRLGASRVPRAVATAR